ncbi:MAG: hypothetical protein ACI8UO_004679 [Verrucomicrobiales bacterium]|jgi:hypothetical protein
MKPTSILLQSDRFAVEWGDDGDASPPPGYEFADALLKRIRLAGAESPIEELPADWWEHSNWYFSATWRGTTYNLTLEPSPDDLIPQTWVVGVAKRLGVFKALFGNNALRHEVDDAFLRIVENCTMEVAGVKSVEWVTENEAIERFWGALPNRSDSGRSRV